MKPPSLAIVIHCEEEFDWTGGFNPANTRVGHCAALLKYCRKLVSLGARPTLAIDYPFITGKQASRFVSVLQKHHPANIEFAAHLHPWVNPPFFRPMEKDNQLSPDLPLTDQPKLAEQNKYEFVSQQESYPGNLPEAQEMAKMSRLTKDIESLTGTRPVTYLAGRYGVGSNSHKILSRLGYRVDLSVTPMTDYRHQSGPDFSQYNNQAFERDGVLCVPHTTGLVSALPLLAKHLNNHPKRYAGLALHPVTKVALKLARCKKWRLSPEGFNAAQMKRLTQTLMASGQRHFVFSLHSPSLVAGNTPYTTNKEKVSALEQASFDYVTWFATLEGARFVLAKECDTER